jgi:hypothetical protein
VILLPLPPQCWDYRRVQILKPMCYNHLGTNCYFGARHLLLLFLLILFRKVLYRVHIIAHTCNPSCRGGGSRRIVV